MTPDNPKHSLPDPAAESTSASPLPPDAPEGGASDDPRLPTREERTKLRVQRLVSLVICLALIFGIGSWMKMVLNPDENPEASAQSSTSPEQADSAEALLNAGTTFDEMTAYAPPALPLTVPGLKLEGQRHLTMDLSGLDDPDGLPVMQLTDEYVIFAPDKAQTTQMVYPYAASFAGLFGEDAAPLPVITVEGSPAQTALHLGSPVENTGWQSWLKALEDGSQLTRALDTSGSAELEALMAQPVTLYTVHGTEALAGMAKDPAVGIALPAGSNLTAYRLSAFGFAAREDGSREFLLSANSPADSPVLMVLGTPESAPTVRAYASSACGPEDLLAEVSLTLEPSPDTLGHALDALVADELAQWPPEALPLVQRAARLLFAARGLAEPGQMDDPLLTEFFDTLLYSPQLFYLTFDVSLPQRGSTGITVSAPIQAGYYVPGEEGNTDLNFDVAATLASTLKFYKYSAQLIFPDSAQLTDNTFGFAPEKGVWLSQPDPQMQRWSLRVRLPDSSAPVDGAPAGVSAEA